MPRRTPAPVNPDGIPEKPFFKIGEAARLCAVKPYVLRYWETEFRSVRPQKTRSKQRLYRRKDGSDLWVNRTVSLAKDAAGKPLYFIRIIEDIGERKRAEEAVAGERARPTLAPHGVFHRTARGQAIAGQFKCFSAIAADAHLIDRAVIPGR